MGPVTVNIFLRELRPYWRKADPEPLPIAYKMAKTIGLDLDSFNRKTLTFTRIEAGLIRLRGQLSKVIHGVGLMDVDHHGRDIPRMLGLRGEG